MRTMLLYHSIEKIIPKVTGSLEFNSELKLISGIFQEIKIFQIKNTNSTFRTISRKYVT